MFDDKLKKSRHYFRVSSSSFHLAFILIILHFFLPGTQVFAKDNYPDKKAKKIYQKAMNVYESGKSDECIRILKKLISDYPDYPEPYYTLGLIQYQLPNYKGLKSAKENFNSYLDLATDQKHYAYYYLGNTCYILEDWACASKNLAMFVKDVDKIRNDEDYDQAVLKLKWARFLQKTHANPIPFTPQLVSPPSTKHDEFLSVLSPDNEILLFTQRKEKKINSSGTQTYRPAYTEAFCFATKQANGEFSQGEPFPYPFNQGTNEGGASISLNNKNLYVTVCKAVKEYQNCDIYTSVWSNSEWSDLEPLPKDINLPDTWEAQACIHPDGKTLFFVSDRSGGLGGNDIWYSKQDENGIWGGAINAGKRINTPGNEKSPFIHPDGNTLYFSSDAWMGLGGYDIFFIKLDDSLSKSPTNMGYPINSEENESGFFASLDGRFGYFSSDKLGAKLSDSNVKKHGGGWDLFSFELPVQARPEDVAVLRGKLEAKHSLTGGKLELVNTITNNRSEISLDTANGNYVSIIKKDEAHILSYKQQGYSFESILIPAIKDSSNQIISQNLKPEELKKGSKYEVKNIFFKHNSYALDHNTQMILNEFFNFLKSNPTLKIEILGYTDDIGDEQYNLRLSKQRAKAVYDYLVQEGISSSRLQYKGYGKGSANKGLSEAERASLRKTLFLITDI